MLLRVNKSKQNPAYYDLESHRSQRGKSLFSLAKIAWGGMQSPKGEMFWNTGVYKEVVPNRRIVSTISFADETGKAIPGSKAPVPGRWPNAVTVIVEFSESSGKTKVTVTEVGLPLIVKILSRVAWDQQFDKIEGLL
jgi:uncharacterized protein YndB with AHSA1/START domain